MRALVTGAGGFTGRALCKLLLEHRVRVFAAGRRSAGVGTFVPLSWPAPAGAVEKVLERVNPDLVFHLAGVASGVPPPVYYEVNAAFAGALLEALRRRAKPCAVLVVGTSAEYGRVGKRDLPIGEDCTPRPYGHYGISKLAQTQLALTYDSPDLRVTVARPFNLIGPGMPSYLAVQAFVDQLVRGTTLQVGNLRPSRDYLHVRDAVEAYWRLLRSPAAAGRIVNVCSGAPLRMREIVDRLVAVAGSHARAEVDPARVKAIDIPVHYGDNSLLRRLTGLRPRLDLDAALNEAFRFSLRAARDDHRRNRK